ncbi:MAG: hypothetical protein EOP84_21150, partial [Verrucomicrobiaceae bacterium]
MTSKLIPYLCLCLVLASSLFAEEKKGTSLVFDVPEGAKFEEKSKGQMEFYSITLKKDTSLGLLMISASPAPISEEMLKPMAEMMKLSFEKAMKENKDLVLKDTKSESREFKEGIWKGYENRFVATTKGDQKVFQLMYVLWDGERSWNAQYTGQEQDYDTVVQILRSIKRNAAAKPAQAPVT